MFLVFLKKFTQLRVDSPLLIMSRLSGLLGVYENMLLHHYGSYHI